MIDGDWTRVYLGSTSFSEEVVYPLLLPRGIVLIGKIRYPPSDWKHPRSRAVEWCGQLEAWALTLIPFPWNPAILPVVTLPVDVACQCCKNTNCKYHLSGISRVRITNFDDVELNTSAFR